MFLYTIVNKLSFTIDFIYITSTNIFCLVALKLLSLQQCNLFVRYKICITIGTHKLLLILHKYQLMIQFICIKKYQLLYNFLKLYFLFLFVGQNTFYTYTYNIIQTIVHEFNLFVAGESSELSSPNLTKTTIIVSYLQYCTKQT